MPINYEHAIAIQKDNLKRQEKTVQSTKELIAGLEALQAQELARQPKEAKK